jgi:hypothetical protein
VSLVVKVRLSAKEHHTALGNLSKKLAHIFLLSQI